MLERVTLCQRMDPRLLLAYAVRAGNRSFALAGEQHRQSALQRKEPVMKSSSLALLVQANAFLSTIRPTLSTEDKLDLVFSSYYRTYVGGLR